ncbi:hypothetical protein BY996DRAFT_6483493 [Phakopsora pachyrhizi]|nr:hypothetical protein BY996DRAFT_6483493 [Phakopsora pachyrhizi]
MYIDHIDPPALLKIHKVLIVYELCSGSKNGFNVKKCFSLGLNPMDDNSHLIRLEYERMELWKILKSSDGLVEKDHEDLD